MNKAHKYSRFSLIIPLIILCFFCQCDFGNTNEDTNELTIGVLLPVTGEGPVQGDAVFTTIEMAVDDLNDFLLQEEDTREISIEFIDTHYDILTYVAGLEFMIDENIKIILTCGTSAEITFLKNLVDTADVILIDHSSTSPLLSVSDNIIRMIPDDDLTSDAVISAMEDAEIEKLITLYRNDIWGTGLNTLIDDKFSDGGGTVVETISYNARSINTEIDEKIALLDSIVQVALTDNLPNEIAVKLISFEEGIDIMEEASKYPALMSVKWFGSDGLTLNEDLLNNALVAPFADSVHFASPVFGEPDEAEFRAMKALIETEVGYSVDPYVLCAYDALWVAGLTLLNDKSKTIEAFKSALLLEFSDHEGICGDIELDANENRIDTHFDFWGLEESSGNYSWIKLYSIFDSEP
jgi:branched-chain amino acid transport system substrate-binding protein